MSGLLFAEMETPPATSRTESQTAERKRKARQAYDATSAAWKTATYNFAVNEFLPVNATFLFEELTIKYNAAARERQLPATVNGKAFAGLQRRLIADGKIELIPGVVRTRSNGQDGKVYRSLVRI